MAKRGKSTMGWFYGFKLHIAITENGELCGVKVTPGNVDDRDLDVLDEVLRNVTGKLFTDKGYISKELFEHLYNLSLTTITKL